MSKCKWDREAEDYLRDDKPCKRDDYGDPTKHCTARRTCSNHIASAELTCAQCVGRTRQAIKRIVDLSALMLPVALSKGVNSEAANLAGPAADPEAWSWRKVAARQGRAWHLSLIEDDDEQHPYSVLTRWEFMLREDYGQQRIDATSITRAADYLLGNLNRIAQDDGQDFPLLAREMRTCRDHLESVICNSTRPERGEPCDDCRRDHPDRPAPRLIRSYGHWCMEEDCREQFHYLDDSGDEWQCPSNRAHVWTEEAYRKWAGKRATTSVQTTAV